MTLVVARIRTRWILQHGSSHRMYASIPIWLRRHFSDTHPLYLAERLEQTSPDHRIEELGAAFENDFAAIRDKYDTPKFPVVLAHGLLGFDELRLAGNLLPGIQYWRGITEALKANGIEVILANVPPSGSIEERALKLGKDIAAKANGRSVNIIAHSMGGLDARYMISRLQPDNVEVKSLTTIATPHRGSAFADWCFTGMLGTYVPQLTTKYMEEEFNPETPDDPTVRYFSYGAVTEPTIFSIFRFSHKIVQKEEGSNDGLVSVSSSRWGSYKGTLLDVSHLGLINWTNKIRWWMWEVTGHERRFNAIAFYLHITDMLAREGL